MASQGTSDEQRWKEILQHVWGVSHAVAHQYWRRKSPYSLDRILAEPAFELRDNVRFRAASVSYHVKLLRSQYAHLNKTAQETWLQRDNDPSFLSNSRDSLVFLADDVHFHAVSLLDYVANLTGHVLRPSDGRTLKWNGVVKSGRDNANPMSQSRTVRLMVRLHDEWIDAFQELRASIIHYRAIRGSAAEDVTLDGQGFNSTLSFPMPDAVRKKFPFLSTASESAEVSLVDGMDQVALETLELAFDVMTELFVELGGVPNPSYKPYQREPPRASKGPPYA